MPPLEKVAGKPKPRRPMTVSEQAAKLRSLALHFGGSIIERGAE